MGSAAPKWFACPQRAPTPLELPNLLPYIAPLTRPLTSNVSPSLVLLEKLDVSGLSEESFKTLLLFSRYAAHGVVVTGRGRGTSSPNVEPLPLPSSLLPRLQEMASRTQDQFARPLCIALLAATAKIVHQQPPFPALVSDEKVDPSMILRIEAVCNALACHYGTYTL